MHWCDSVPSTGERTIGTASALAAWASVWKRIMTHLLPKPLSMEYHGNKFFYHYRFFSFRGWPNRMAHTHAHLLTSLPLSNHCRGRAILFCVATLYPKKERTKNQFHPRPSTSHYKPVFSNTGKLVYACSLSLNRSANVCLSPPSLSLSHSVSLRNQPYVPAHNHFNKTGLLHSAPKCHQYPVRMYKKIAIGKHVSAPMRILSFFLENF